MSAIEKKWQQRWEEQKLFQSEVDVREKYFVNFPYPYMNGYLHIGHSFTLMRVEILARYKRMKGFNVLFPFGFHCTGTPIVAAAKRIADNEPKQIAILKDMGIPDADIPRFKEPVHWATYFPEEAQKDLKALGLSVDWRRSFITTSLNPYYDRFIAWQFRKLNEGGYVGLGSHPVIWCPKCGQPIGDHDRMTGEGETPQEFTLLKFRCADLGDNVFVVAATLRPETVFGQTNLWVDADIAYVKAGVDDETWIVSRECAEKLGEQDKAVSIIGEIRGSDLIGTYCTAPGIDRDIIVLPSHFCDPAKGTGIVTSVPSDAPDDWMGLYNLQRSEAECRKYGLDWETVKKIKPIPIIQSELGELPAVKICEEMSIRSQNEREKLKKAKEIIYKSGFYTGVLNENCGAYAGRNVEDAKEAIKKELIDAGKADVFYETSGEVVCRCLTKGIVKLVTNQWFLKYGDKAWKKRTHGALDTMKLYPEIARKHFDYVIDWLDDWACTREEGLGTKLPWDDKWLIESLSDSTIYMAYYTISHYLEHEKAFDAAAITDAFFDYVFLGKGSARTVAHDVGADEKTIKKIRKEFEYWYPFDFRCSGKDLVQNHLTFCLFNHTAIFPEKYWPKGFGVNGWILVDGQKMSKSAGNFYTLRELVARFGADVVRITLAYAGEGLDDPNWSSEFATSVSARLKKWFDFAIENYGKGDAFDEPRPIDAWFISVMNRVARDVTAAMDAAMFRTALKIGFFDLQTSFSWYAKRCNGVFNKEILARFIELQTTILAPIAPHISEEIWERIGKKGFIAMAAYPTADESAINVTLDASEIYLKAVIDDIREIIRVTKASPKKITLFTAPAWKWAVYNKAIALAKEGGINPGTLIKDVMAIDDVRKQAKEAAQFAQKLAVDIKTKKINVDSVAAINELEYLMGVRDFLEHEFGCAVDVHAADLTADDPKGKAKFAAPLRPAILLE